jgi:hypothetical protein
MLMLASVRDCDAWVPNENVVRTERTVEITVIENEANIRIRSLYKNPTEEPLSVKAWMPVAHEEGEVKSFINVEGQALHFFSGRARLDALADAAEAQKDARFFRLAAAPWKRVLRTPEFTIPAGETTQVVWDYTAPVLQQEGFTGIEVFLDDGVTDDLFQSEFSVATQKSLQHFWAPVLEDAIISRSGQGLVALHQIANFSPTQNLRILWSSEENPAATFFAGGYKYIAHFRTLPPAQEFQNVTLLLDTSGSMSDVWTHAQELLRFLLEHQETRSFRVVFVGEDGLEWLVGNDETFEANSRELQKKVLESVSWKTPIGKADINGVLSRLNKPAENHVVMVFSDEEHISIPESGAPVSTLQFFPASKSTAWKKVALATKGIVQRAFRSIWGTKEAEEFLSSIEDRRQPLFANDIELQEGEHDLLPSESFTPVSTVISPLFVGRVASDIRSNETHSFFDWLPHYWARMRIVEILEKGKREHSYSTESLDAVLAIARTFGLRSQFFTHMTSRGELLQTLSQSEDVWLVVEKMWKTSAFLQEAGVRLREGLSLWKDEKNVWRSFDFYDRVSPERWVKIAPFSSAQRQLFVLFPEVFAQPFGFGSEVEFCSLFRCFSVVKEGRSDPVPSDRAFVRDFDPNHWAVPFVVDLVQKNILEPELNGKLHLDRAISRAEFAEMIVFDTYGKGFKRELMIPQFTDLLPGEDGFDAVQLLVHRGIIKGYPDGTFRPKQDLTRAEAMKILLALKNVSLAEIKVGEMPLFPDTLGWERSWVEEAVRRNIVSGYADGTFQPHKPLTRAAAAKIIVQGR